MSGLGKCEGTTVNTVVGKRREGEIVKGMVWHRWEMGAQRSMARQ